MPHIGSFGAAIRELDPDADRKTFDFFGEDFTVEGVIPGMLSLQLGAVLAGRISDADGTAAVYEALKCALTVPAREVDGEKVAEDDSAFLRFHRLAIRNKCDDFELIRLVLNIAGYQVGKATEHSPTSQPGERPTSTSSNSSSSDSQDSPAAETSAG